MRPFKPFWDEPKTHHVPLPTQFSAPFFAQTFFPPTYLPPPTSILPTSFTSFHVHSIATGWESSQA